MILRLLLLTVVGALLPALVLAPATALGDEAPVDVTISIPPGMPGQQVTAQLTALRAGEPAPGLAVVFTWIGPNTDPEGVTTTTTTDEAGTARTDVVLDTQTAVMGRVLDAAGEELGSATAVYGAIDCRCSPVMINARLRARDASGGTDVLTLRSPRAGEDAVVKLLRVRDGVATRIRRTVLGEDGKVTWRVEDHNGRRPTEYFARISATVVSGRDTTKIVAAR